MASEGVTVDFEPRQEVIEGIRASGHWAMDGAWLEIEELRMPFIFRVGSLNLVPRGSRASLAPLLCVARIVPWFVRNLRDGVSDRLFIPRGGGVWMKRSGDRVLLRPLPPGRGETVETEYSMLLSALEDCSSRIRDYLARELPEIVGNPDLAPWFRGEEG